MPRPCPSRGQALRLYCDVAAGVLHNPTPETVLRALGSADFVSADSFRR